MPIHLGLDLPTLPTDSLLNFLKYGQFGAAMAMLILGFYLSWAASNAPIDAIPAKKSVAYQFMVFAILFFILCSAGEIIKALLPELHPQVNVMITVPPMDDDNFKEYGEVEIVMLDGQQQDKKRASDRPQLFTLHNGTAFTISLNRLVKKLTEVKTAKQVVENNLVAETPALGPGSAK
jgi:hypothetical protein